MVCKTSFMHLNCRTTGLDFIKWVNLKLSLMAEWLEQASQWHKMYWHNLEVMSLNPSWAELGSHYASVLSHTWAKKRKRNYRSSWISCFEICCQRCQIACHLVGRKTTNTCWPSQYYYHAPWWALQGENTLNKPVESS